MTKIVDYEIKKLKDKDDDLVFHLEFEDGAEIILEMNPNLAYNMAHKIMDRVEKANGMPILSDEASHFSTFIGMRD